MAWGKGTSVKTVLIVDDEPDVLLLCRVNLEFEGYDVHEAHNGEDALAKISSVKPDLIVLDVMMPGMDGWQVLESLKSNPQTEQIPIVMLTAKVQESDQIKGLSYGAIDYVTKPFNPLALTRTVREALESDGADASERRRQQMLDKLRLLQKL